MHGVDAIVGLIPVLQFLACIFSPHLFAARISHMHVEFGSNDLLELAAGEQVPMKCATGCSMTECINTEHVFQSTLIPLENFPNSLSLTLSHLISHKLTRNIPILFHAHSRLRFWFFETLP